jgi:TolA-binding protein
MEGNTMRFSRCFMLATLVGAMLPAAMPAGTKKLTPMEELQLEITQLQEDVKALRSALESKIGNVQTLDQQTFDSVSKTNVNVGSMNTGLTQALQSEITRVTEISDKVIGLSVKLDNATNDIANLRGAVDGLVVTANKQQQMLSDVFNLTKLNQASVAAPPPAALPPTGEELFTMAVRDAKGGKAELALSEFAEFLRVYPNDPNANRAQYQIADIHYEQQKLEEAVAEYEAAIQLSPKDVAVVPDAYLRKGMALQKEKKRNEAIISFVTVALQFPETPQAAKARSQLTLMHAGVLPPK